MKKVILNAVAMCALLAGATGCDFFRSLAGLPTSAVIAELQAKADTLACKADTAAAVADSIAAVTDTIAVATDTLTNATDSLAAVADTIHCNADTCVTDSCAVADTCVAGSCAAASADTVAVQTADTCEMPNSEALTSETAPEVVTPAPEQETITPAPSTKTVYYILVGSFAEKANAENMARVVRKYGYEPHILKRGRLTCVGLCPTDDISEARAALNKVKRHSFCPADVCIYSRTEQL